MSSYVISGYLITFVTFAIYTTRTVRRSRSLKSFLKSSK